MEVVQEDEGVLKRLWAPWRLSYLKGDVPSASLREPTDWQPGASGDCFLCRSAANYEDQAAADHAHLVVWRGEHSLVGLNRFPYANGHLLVSPLRHAADLGDLQPAEHLEIIETIATHSRVLRDLIQAQGFNIGLNLGDVAGAGIPGHLHWHVVPRWAGDHNFMPTVAQTRVIPQSLEALWEILSATLAGSSKELANGA